MSSLNRMKQSSSSIKLWPEQEPAVSFVVQRPKAALFFQQRTGKTFITMSILEQLERSDMAVVLVCILTNKETTWSDNLTKFLPWLNVTTDWEEFKKLEFPKLLLMHHEMIHTIAVKIRRVKWVSMCVVDESHRWKARGSRMSRAGAKLTGIPRKLLLTGTPIEKQPKDLWAQFRFLAPDVFGKWADFEREFMDFTRIDMDGVKPGTARWQLKIIQQGMLRSRAKFKREKLPKLLDMIKPYCLRLTKEDVGILAPVIERVDVELLGQQRKLYDQMKKDSVIRFGDTRVMATMKVTQIIKRREIANGFVFDDYGNKHVLGYAKLNALVKLFEKLPKPIVIFTEFSPENDMIVEVLRDLDYDIAVLTGRTKKSQRAVIQRDFQRAQYDGIVCQSRAGGVGIDLWRANYAIAHSIGYSSITFEQMASRLDAKHKLKPARIFVLTATRSIDTDLYNLVIEKGLDAKEVLNQLKERI